MDSTDRHRGFLFRRVPGNQGGESGRSSASGYASADPRRVVVIQVGMLESAKGCLRQISTSVEESSGVSTDYLDVYFAHIDAKPRQRGTLEIFTSHPRRKSSYLGAELQPQPLERQWTSEERPGI